MKQPKTFRYTLDPETLLNYQKLSAEDRLNWLAEANEFNYLVLSKAKKDIQNEFLHGKAEP